MASKSRTQTKPKQKRSAYFIGAVVATALALLTIGEYFLALVNPSPTYLFLIAFLKAILVVYFFMHVYRLWRVDSHAVDVETGTHTTGTHTSGTRTRDGGH